MNKQTHSNVVRQDTTARTECNTRLPGYICCPPTLLKPWSPPPVPSLQQALSGNKPQPAARPNWQQATTGNGPRPAASPNWQQSHTGIESRPEASPNWQQALSGNNPQPAARPNWQQATTGNGPRPAASQNWQQGPTGNEPGPSANINWQQSQTGIESRPEASPNRQEAPTNHRPEVSTSTILQQVPSGIKPVQAIRPHWAPTVHMSKPPRSSLYRLATTGYSAILPSPPQCGRTFVKLRSRIVGGAPAPAGSWPWIALLGYIWKQGDDKINWNCGGTLINEMYVVTAGHCIDPYGYSLTKVRLGEDEIGNLREDYSPVDVPVVEKIMHPNYVMDEKHDDIALVKLQYTVKFTEYIQPICLPVSPELRSRSFMKYRPFVAGWGATSVGGPTSKKLLQTQVPVVSPDICDRAYKPHGARITEDHICAGYMEGGKDACQGDSGGPLMLPEGNIYYLIGVVSFGYKCAEKDHPGVYTRVSSYIEWIAATIQR